MDIIAAIRAVARRLVRHDKPPIDPTEHVRRETLAAAIDQSLVARRRDRAERQESARQREVAKHHRHFTHDPLIRATRHQVQGQPQGR